MRLVGTGTKRHAFTLLWRFAHFGACDELGGLPASSVLQKTNASAPTSSTTFTFAGIPSAATSSDSGRTPITSVDLPLPATPVGKGTLTPPKEAVPFESGTVQRFIAGEPMKPATKTFAGTLVELTWRTDLLEVAFVQHGDAGARGSSPPTGRESRTPL